MSVAVSTIGRVKIYKKINKATILILWNNNEIPLPIDNELICVKTASNARSRAIRNITCIQAVSRRCEFTHCDISRDNEDILRRGLHTYFIF